jgi:hypothetical protein
MRPPLRWRWPGQLSQIHSADSASTLITTFHGSNRALDHKLRQGWPRSAKEGGPERQKYGAWKQDAHTSVPPYAVNDRAVGATIDRSASLLVLVDAVVD